MKSIRQEDIKTLGRIESYKNDIRVLADSFEDSKLWRPGGWLKKQSEQVYENIKELESRFNRKLVATILGPCGAGKSTLLNALSGVDHLSETGYNRPTTKTPVVLCRDRDDAEFLRGRMGSGNLRIESSHAASPLEQIILIDTPDTDSTEQEKHIPLVKKAISISDVLICLFNSENPKRKDYIDFLHPYIRKFNGESLLCVMYKCDRQDEEELKEKIVPDFTTYVQKAWDYPLEKVYCVSARRHLHHPDWDEKARPKHDFDEFEELRGVIFGEFNTPGYVIDRRLANAESLRNYIFQEVKEELNRDRELLSRAKESIEETERDAMKNSLLSLQKSDPKGGMGVSVLLYQKLALRWIGPVGWLVAIWARMLIFGAGLAAMVRFGSPVTQISGMISSFKHFKESRAAVAEAENTEKVVSALRKYKTIVMQGWPDIAESLIRARFHGSVRNVEKILPEGDVLGRELNEIWNEALDSAIDRAARALSGLFLQFIFNIPVIAVLGYSGWITTKAFFTGNFFTSDFFLHAFFAIGIVLFLCFFIFQGIVRLAAGPKGITKKAFALLKERAGTMLPNAVNPVSRQIDAVLNLSPVETESKTPRQNKSM